MPVQHGPEFWRQRAAEAKATARLLTDREAKRAMLIVAADYEALAKSAEALEARRATGAAKASAAQSSATSRRYVLAANIERFEKQLCDGDLGATQIKTIIALLEEARAELDELNRGDGKGGKSPH
jgi:hypothetical protein